MVVNLTSHSYFNLAGKGNVLGHELMIAADRFTPVNKRVIPTGEFRSVKRTPFDFTMPTRIDQDNEQMKLGNGYDHNWVLNNYDGSIRTVARLYEPTTGSIMEVRKTEPCLQFYTGNFLNNKMISKAGTPYAPRSGLCLETQHIPDPPNKPEFPQPNSSLDRNTRH
jgi:aldose 1-epimerase